MQDCKFTFSFIINWPSIVSEPRSCCQSRRVWKHGEPKLKTKTKNMANRSLRTWPTEVEESFEQASIVEWSQMRQDIRKIFSSSKKDPRVSRVANLLSKQAFESEAKSKPDLTRIRNNLLEFRELQIMSSLKFQKSNCSGANKTI